MNTFLRTDEFDAWLAGLNDNVARARIVHRIRSALLNTVILVTVSRSARAFRKCASTSALGIALTTHDVGR